MPHSSCRQVPPSKRLQRLAPTDLVLGQALQLGDGSRKGRAGPFANSQLVIELAARQRQQRGWERGWVHSCAVGLEQPSPLPQVPCERRLAPRAVNIPLLEGRLTRARAVPSRCCCNLAVRSTWPESSSKPPRPSGGCSLVQQAGRRMGGQLHEWYAVRTGIQQEPASHCWHSGGAIQLQPLQLQ